jgi:hypothetical protein
VTAVTAVTAVSARLARRVARDFGADAVFVVDLLESVREDELGLRESERMQAALVLAARGDLAAFASYLDLLRVDWRDVLVAGGLAEGDWPRRLDEELA